MLFTSVAYAMGAGGQAGGTMQEQLMGFLPLILMFAIFYFLLIRPQQKKAKAHRAMLEGLKKGDYVITGGGLYGRIVEVNGDEMTINLGQTEVKVARAYVSGMVEPKAKEAAKDAKK